MAQLRSEHEEERNRTVEEVRQELEDKHDREMTQLEDKLRAELNDTLSQLKVWSLHTNNTSCISQDIKGSKQKGNHWQAKGGQVLHSKMNLEETGLPRHRENREFESPFFQTGKTQGIC